MTRATAPSGSSELSLRTLGLSGKGRTESEGGSQLHHPSIVDRRDGRALSTSSLDIYRPIDAFSRSIIAPSLYNTACGRPVALEWSR